MIKVCLSAYHGFDEHEYARWLYSAMGDIPHVLSLNKGALVFMNRNHAFARDGYDGYDYLSVDTDIRFTRENVQRLIDDDLDIVSGAYAFRGNPGYYCANDADGLIPVTATGLRQVATTGAGFLYIKNHVVQKLKPLIFRHEYAADPDTGEETQTGEDSGFSIHAMRNGFRQWLDCDCVVEHLI